MITDKQIKLIERALPYLQCPISGGELKINSTMLKSISSQFAITDEGIPCFMGEYCSNDSKVQQEHYDKVSTDYINNLSYPHTQEYIKYLDSALDKVAKDTLLGDTAEICCGTGEAFSLYHDEIDYGIGVDVSLNMLRGAREKLFMDRFFFMQGDATRLPLKSNSFDTVFCLGGIHHVNNRDVFFSEVHRILKPGGRFIWREPVNDFLIWRVIRDVIYRLSPHLDYDTESPLRYDDTVPVLEKVGMKVDSWETYGFFGFCIFMNSDVLFFNRLFRFLPGIRKITRWAAKFDDLITNLPGMKRSGLQVIGVARKGLP